MNLIIGELGEMSPIASQQSSAGSGCHDYIWGKDHISMTKFFISTETKRGWHFKTKIRWNTSENVNIANKHNL